MKRSTRLTSKKNFDVTNFESCQKNTMVEFVRLSLFHEKSVHTIRIFLRKEGSFLTVEDCKTRAGWDAAEIKEMIKDKFSTLIDSNISNEAWFCGCATSRSVVGISETNSSLLETKSIQKIQLVQFQEKQKLKSVS